MVADETLVIIMAGGAGERLQPLTKGRSHLEVSFDSLILR